jgi:hypothetical protein
MYDRLISFVSKYDLLIVEHFRFRDGMYTELASQIFIEYSIEIIRYCEVFRKMIFKTVSGSGTIIS